MYGVFSHGKAGSKSLVAALQEGLPGRVIWDVQAASRRGVDHHVQVKGGDPADISSDDIEFLAEVERRRVVLLKLVTPVREPIATAISSFFNTYDSRRALVPIDRLEDDVIIDSIVDGHAFSEPEYHLEWFDREFRPFLGCDVYRGGAYTLGLRCRSTLEVEFLEADQYRVTAEVLIIRLEDFQLDVSGLLSDFFGSAIPALRVTNDGINRSYAQRYRRFLETASFPRGWVEGQLGSRYSTFFYSDAERSAFVRRWCDASRGA